MMAAKQALQRTKGKPKDDHQQQSPPQDQTTTWHGDYSPHNTNKNTNTGK
jgi:hypothetical protein